MSAKQVSTQCTNDQTEPPSVFPEDCGGSFSFTQARRPQASCTCAHSKPTSFLSTTIWATHGLCANILHSTGCYSSALHIIAIPKGPTISAKCNQNQKKTNQSNYYSKNPHILFNYENTFFFWLVYYIYRLLWPINGQTLGSHFSQLALYCKTLTSNAPQPTVLLMLPVRETIFPQPIYTQNPI